MICSICRQEKENVEIINKEVIQSLLDIVTIEKTLIAIVCEDCKDKKPIYEYMYGNDKLNNYMTLKEYKPYYPSSIVGTISMLRAIYGDEEMDRFEEKQELEFQENQKYYEYLYNKVIQGK
jgi:hypothetical protein